MRFLDIYGTELKKRIESHFCDYCVIGETINIEG